MSDADAGGVEVDWARVKEVFSLVSEAEPARRAELLNRLTAEDPAVRAEVRSLMASHETAAAPLPTPPPNPPGGAPDSADGADETVRPARIGLYEIESLLGEGGFGLVYRARQRSPVERAVALKVLRPDGASREAVQRFAAERRVQARMDHPGIVKVFDAGLSPEGEAFIAMELVDGPTIVEYVRDHHPPVVERTRLIAETCRAVHHAHQRAVLHRDVKPSNILVSAGDGDARPRIIDFGVAKSLAEVEGGVGVGRTRAGAIIGTPTYMSPAQLMGEPAADVRTDVYALGVVLCEVLTGATPRDPRTVSSRLPHETPAELPSRLAARALRDAGGVRAQAALPGRALRGELDRIVLKATAWDPEDRYESAAALADDLDRFARGEPVLAAGPSPVYRARKFVARHRVSSLLGVVAALALVVGAGAAGVGERRARAAERAAAQDAARAEAITEFLLADMIDAADPDLAEGRDVTIAEVLDAAIREAERRFEQDPALLLDVLERVGAAYDKLQRYEDAAAILGDAAALSERLEGPSSQRSLRLRLDETLALIFLPGRHEDAIAMQAGVRDRAVASLGPDHPVSIRARLHHLRVGEVEPAAALAEAEEIRRVLAGRGMTRTPEHLACLHTLAAANSGLGMVDEEVELHAEAERIARGLYGPDHSIRLRHLFQLASALVRADRPAEGAEYAEEVLERQTRIHGEEDPIVVAASVNVINAQLAAGRPDRALRTATENAARVARMYGEDAVPHTTALKLRAAALVAADRPAEALAILERLLALQQDQWGPDHAMVGDTHGHLARALHALGAHTRAAEHAEMASARFGPEAHQHYHFGALAGRCRLEAGSSAEAEAILTRVRDRAIAQGSTVARIALRKDVLPALVEVYAVTGDDAARRRTEAELAGLLNAGR